MGKGKVLQKKDCIVAGLVYPVVLMILCLAPVNQGVDMSDSMFTIANGKLFLQADSDWNLFMAYYLANLIGFLITKLPFGATLLGMKVYTSLIIYATGLMVYAYYGKRKEISMPILLIGEAIAIVFQWCPSTVLYNFVTFFFFTFALLLLREGLLQGRKSLLFLAGIVLGLNQFTRFPNLVAGAYLMLVMYEHFVFQGNRKNDGKSTKKQITELVEKLVCCVGGFLASFLVLFVMTEVIYGWGNYANMIAGLFGMTDSATDYKATSQIGKLLMYYVKNFPFFIGMVLAVSAGTTMFWLLNQKKSLQKIAKVVYLLCIPVLIRLYYGRGLFGTDYQSDFAVIFIGNLFLWIVIVVCFITIFMKDREDGWKNRKYDALMVLITIGITPLGSNNGIYPNLSNLFLVAPIGISLFFELVKKGKQKLKDTVYPGFRFAANSMFWLFLVFMLIQGTLFHTLFAFKGQDENQKRDAKIENNGILRNMKTNAGRADMLEEVLSQLEKAMDENDEQTLLSYGDLPGLFFVIDAKPELSTIWPDLDSYPYDKMEKEIRQIKDRPVLCFSKEVYDKMSHCEEISKKEALLKQFLKERNYQLYFENSGYVILL